MNKWRWSLLHWREDNLFFVQIARFDGDANREVLSTVTSTVSAAYACSRARKLAKLNCALQGESWAKKASKEIVKALA